MTQLTESQIESFAIQLFEHLGYKSLYGPDIAPDGPNPLRTSFEEVVLKESLRKAVRRINHELSAAVCEDAVNEVLRIAGQQRAVSSYADGRGFGVSTPGGSREGRVGLAG